MNNPRDWESHDEAVSDLYQATRDIEPPAWLDESILATARTAVGSPSKPATPSGRRRSARLWAMPLALAATILMAVGIVRLARETGEWTPPRLEMPMKAQSVAKPAAEADAALPGQRELGSAKQQPASTPPLPAPAPPAEPAQPMMRMAPSQRQQTDRSPEEWLARIASLRQQGRTAEAQASLEEFRRRYPHYPQPIGEGTD